MESTTNLRSRLAATSSIPTSTTAAPIQSTTNKTVQNNKESILHSSTFKFLLFLILTVLLGSLYSLTQISSEITSFRSRIPSSSSSQHLKTTTNSNSFDYLLPLVNINYFANKSNFLNQFFVKKAWAWTTLTWFLLVLTQYFQPPIKSRIIIKKSGVITNIDEIFITESKEISLKKVTKEIYRWFLSSLIWYYLTQSTWFLFKFGKGPSIYHKVLLATGAQCYPSSLSSSTPNTEGLLEEAVGICTGGGGEYWKGGHDVSGHIFLLVHASLFLYGSIKSTLPHLPPFSSFYTSNPTAVARRETIIISPLHALITYATVGLMSLWWWMLLMTSLHFHTPGEKISGLIFAILSWFIVG